MFTLVSSYLGWYSYNVRHGSDAPHHLCISTIHGPSSLFVLERRTQLAIIVSHTVQHNDDNNAYGDLHIVWNRYIIFWHLSITSKRQSRLNVLVPTSIPSRHGRSRGGFDNTKTQDNLAIFFSSCGILHQAYQTIGSNQSFQVNFLVHKTATEPYLSYDIVLQESDTFSYLPNSFSPNVAW
jgi:hypothetical protein